MVSMQTLMIVLAVSTASAIQITKSVSELRVKGAQGSDTVKALRGSVAYMVDAVGRETAATQSAMTSEAKEWLHSIAASRSHINTIKREQSAGSRNFERRQANRRLRYKESGMRDLYQEQIDKFAKKREQVAEEEKKMWAKAEASAWSDFFHKEVKVPHLTYSKRLAIKQDDDDQNPAQMRIQIASQEKDKRMGLMYQKMVPEDAGMLFVYNRPASQVLYMKDTKVPLEVGWFDKEGTLLEIMPLKPMDTTWRWSKSSDAVFGLEANQGFWERNSLEAGKAKIDVQEVCDSMIVDGEMNYDLCESHFEGRNNDRV